MWFDINDDEYDLLKKAQKDYYYDLYSVGCLIL